MTPVLTSTKGFLVTKNTNGKGFFFFLKKKKKKEREKEKKKKNGKVVRPPDRRQDALQSISELTEYIASVSMTIASQTDAQVSAPPARLGG